MRPRLGVVSTAGRDLETGRPGVGGRRSAEGYLVGSDGRTTWFEDGAERAERGEGTGTMLVVAEGEGETVEAAATAAASACRVMGKLWRSEVADPERALVEFVARAHTRMYWKTRERGTSLGASCAVAWIVGDRLHFVELGTARVALFRDGRLHRVGRSWPGSDRQRLLAGSVGLGDDSAVHLERGRNAGTLALAPGDEVLVATEGLGRALDEVSTALVLQHVDDPQVAAVTLLDRALARGATGGITVAIADLHGAAPRTRAAPRPDPPRPRRIRALATEP